MVEEGASQPGVRQSAASLLGVAGTDLGILPDTNPEPKQNLLTKAQDFDAKLLSKQEKARKAANTAVQTKRAIGQPFDRAQDWIKNFVDDLLARNEDETKARMLEDKNFRTDLKKVWHLALKFEMFSVLYVLAPCFGIMYALLTYHNQTNMKKEVQAELMTELEVIDDKISRAKRKGTQEGFNEAYELMRIKRRLIDKASKVTSDPFAKIQPLRRSSNYEWDFD